MSPGFRNRPSNPLQISSTVAENERKDGRSQQALVCFDFAKMHSNPQKYLKCIREIFQKQPLPNQKYLETQNRVSGIRNPPHTQSPPTSANPHLSLWGYSPALPTEIRTCESCVFSLPSKRRAKKRPSISPPTICRPKKGQHSVATY